MKRTLLLIFALMAMTVALCAKTYQVTASKLNVRNAPENGAVVGSLVQGTEVNVLSISGGWAEIKFKGKTAYISAKYITPIKQNASSSSSTSSSSSKTSAKSGKEVKATSGVTNHAAAGFHVTFDLLWEGRNVYSRINVPGSPAGLWSIYKMGAKGNNVYGLCTGFGFEYNGIVKSLPKANIMVGFRTGIYYDWHGGIGEDMNGDGSLFGRWSHHSFTFPLQPVLSFEWQTSKGIPMAFGIFTGPIFEPYFMQNWVETGSGGFGFTNYVTGHYISLSGGSGAGIGTMEYPDRCGVFSCLWGTGFWFQISRIRLMLSTDWEINNFSWVNGGTYADGTTRDHQDGHLNRFITLGFQIVLH